MSPNWKAVEPGLVAIFGTLALPDSSNPQQPGWSPEWKDRAPTAAPVKGPLVGTKLYMRITSVIGVGEDDRRLEFVPANTVPATPYNGMYKETTYGLRRVTLNLQAEMSVVADGTFAVGLLERIRSRLRRRRVIDALLALDIAIVRILAANALPVLKSQHVQQRASMDVILTMLSGDTDPVPTSWIQTLVITSKIQDVAGNELPVPPNISNLVVTP